MRLLHEIPAFIGKGGEHSALIVRRPMPGDQTPSSQTIEQAGDVGHAPHEPSLKRAARYSTPLRIAHVEDAQDVELTPGDAPLTEELVKFQAQFGSQSGAQHDCFAFRRGPIIKGGLAAALHNESVTRHIYVVNIYCLQHIIRMVRW